MPKPRKSLGSIDAPYLVPLKQLIVSQSKPTIIRWSIDCAEEFCELYERLVPGDSRPRLALQGAEDWLAGHIKLPVAKPLILACHAAAREADDNPAAQAAARAIGQAASTIHAAGHCLGLVFYGAAATAYDRIGLSASPDEYEMIAMEVTDKVEAALRAIAVDNEPNPATINWNR